MARFQPLTELHAGMQVLVGGDRVLEIAEEIARDFRPGDAVFALEEQNELLLVPRAARDLATSAVNRAVDAFGRMGSVSDQAIRSFYAEFSQRLADDTVWREITQVNEADVTDARRRGRSTTRLVASEAVRRNMIDGLRGWIDQPSRRGQLIERVEHDGWHADLLGAALGVVGFVFEGRPNVVADATGVLSGGNTVVFRIGGDALQTAKAILEHALTPALVSSGLPEHAVGLVDSTAHAAGWALFSDARLSLAVARGSGPAVDTLGALARRAGVPVSLHGTGGAWMFAGIDADPGVFERAVFDSLDRKVCNTLNTCCIPELAGDRLLVPFLKGLERAAERRGHPYRLHVARGSEHRIPSWLFEKQVTIRRAHGDVVEPQASVLDAADLGREWEWEESPEVTLTLVSDLDHAIELFNQYSPQFVACLVSPDTAEHERFYQRVNAPFVGDGFTRWVDGQFALRRPELGLSNWQHGRLFGRGGVLSGDSVFSVRTRVQRES